MRATVMHVDDQLASAFFARSTQVASVYFCGAGTQQQRKGPLGAVQTLDVAEHSNMRTGKVRLEDDPSIKTCGKNAM